MELLDEALKLTCDLQATVSLLDLVQRGIVDKAPEMMEVADALRQIGEHLDGKTSKLIDLIDEATYKYQEATTWTENEQKIL